MVLTMTSFGEVLREVMSEKGVKQTDLARRCGVPQQTLSHYINDRREPSWVNVVAIADALGVPLDTFRGSMPPVEKGKAGERQEEGAGDE